MTGSRIEDGTAIPSEILIVNAGWMICGNCRKKLSSVHITLNGSGVDKALNNEILNSIL